ncbi:hypothetical protein RUM43_010390 [Polyplax serrata]|uniref:Uncharacterized protein n=1 Tax=Polyplax serrata TaxID=468196 RepID=A0AAN8Q4S1_POLSC
MEARTHGVAYYEFSTDEAERARQQEELKNLRKETENQQAATLAAAQKKQRLMEERLKAARRRKRERLGLPLDEEEPEEVKEEEKKPEPPEELRRDVRKATTVRPWDIGKDNTPKIMTQEEWVEKKRSERIQEFAPPPSQEPRKTIQKKRRYQEYREEEPVKMEPVPIVDELDEGQEEVRGRGVEIAPPPTFEMYGPSSKPRQSHMRPNQTSIDKSIEEGLNFLRRQVEEKQKKKRRDESIEII